MHCNKRGSVKTMACSAATVLLGKEDVNTHGVCRPSSIDCPHDVLQATDSPEHTCLDEGPLGADAVPERPEQQLLHVRQTYRAGWLHCDLCAGLHSTPCINHGTVLGQQQPVLTWDKFCQ